MNITLQGVSARHPAARVGHAPALRSLDLQIASGEQVAVIGPSGAGKTTLLQVMACALPPTEGRFTLDGREPWALPRSALQRQRGQLFLAPQVPPLPPRQRVVTSVLAARLPSMGLLASLRSLFYPNDIPAAFDALDHFDLADKLFERVDRLSGGERQRVMLARVLAQDTPLMLLDDGAAHVRGAPEYWPVTREMMRVDVQTLPPDEVFQNAMDQIPVLAWSASADGAADYFNRGWLEYTGLRVINVENFGSSKAGEDFHTQIFRLPRKPAAQIAKRTCVGALVVHEARCQEMRHVKLASLGQYPVLVIVHWRISQRASHIAPVRQQFVKRLWIYHSAR